MAYEEKEMHKGNWSCSKCGGAITELPFEPDPSREGQLKCRDCHRQGREQRGDSNFQKEMHKGNWSCSKCGGAITELPFEPDPSREGQLKCGSCYKSERSF